MKRRMFVSILGICFIMSMVSAQLPVLTKKEVKQGWVLLFDGQSSKGWERSNGNAFPSTGWVINNGVLTVIPSKDSHGGGDIVSLEDYSDFELKFDFKVTVGANSGIKYFFSKYEKGGLLGLEYQILDDAVNPDAKLGVNGNRVCGAFYDMIPPSANRKVKPVGEWNTARIVSLGKHVEHWLNGVKIVEYDRGSEVYMKALKQSKFKDAVPSFGSVDKGRILLQDHGSEVSFRNIKIKKL
jgi:hypothetical protein